MQHVRSSRSPSSSTGKAGPRAPCPGLLSHPSRKAWAGELSGTFSSHLEQPFSDPGPWAQCEPQNQDKCPHPGQVCEESREGACPPPAVLRTGPRFTWRRCWVPCGHRGPGLQCHLLGREQLARCSGRAGSIAPRTREAGFRANFDQVLSSAHQWGRPAGPGLALT